MTTADEAVGEIASLSPEGNRNEPVDVDRALSIVGGYRPWHMTALCFLAVSSFMPICLQSLSIVFIGWEPPHHCKIPEDALMNETIPSSEGNNGQITWSKCTQYVNRSVSNATTDCTDGWSYNSNGYITIVTEFDLVCTQNYKAELSQFLYQVAATFSDCVCAFLTDKYGRKKVHLSVLMMLSCIGVGIAFAPNYLWFVVLRMGVGMLAISALNSGLTIIMELFDARRRTFAGINLEYGWVLIYMGPLITGYLFLDWRTQQLVNSLLSFIWIIYIWFLPESVPWLVAYKRYDDAEQVIAWMARMNRVKLSHPIKLMRNDNILTTVAYIPKDQVSGDLESTPLKYDHPPNGKMCNGDSIANSYTESHLNGFANSDLRNGDAAHNSESHTNLCANRGEVRNADSAASAVSYSNGCKNGHDVPSVHVVNKEDSEKGYDAFDSERAQTQHHHKLKGEKVPLSKLFTDPKLRLHLIMSNIFWFTNAAIYYGLILSSPQFGPNRFLNYFLMGAIEIPVYLITLYLLNWVGRRKCMFAFYILAGVPLAVVIFVPQETSSGRDLQPVILVLILVAKFGITGSFAVMLVYIRELFPASLRSSCTAWCSVAGGLGNSIAPFTAYMSKQIFWLPNVFYAISSIVAALCVIPLPETNKLPLPITIEDVYTTYYHVPYKERTTQEKR